MDYVREALDKANVSLDNAKPAVPLRPAPVLTVASPGEPRPVPVATPPWTAPQVQLDAKRLERNRIVSFSMADPSHVPFNMLRTRVRAAMEANNWKSIGITSPSPGCGKTMVSINLAASLARGADLRTVLIDFDLKRPSIAHTLGLSPTATVTQVLAGKAEIGDCFVQIAPGLTVALGGGHIRESSELLQSARAKDLLDFVNAKLSPDVILFDLPPMGASDDVLALLPRIDAALLVAAAGQTTVTEIDNCEQQISQHGRFVGVVLNKAEIETKDYYY